MQRADTTWPEGRLADPSHLLDAVSAVKTRLLAKLCYRRLNLYVDDLAEPERLAPSGVDLVVRRLTEDDAEAYHECRPQTSRRAALRRLRSGDDCFGIFNGDRLLGFVWSTHRRARVSYVNLPVYLERDAVYSYDLYVRPDARGGGVAGRLLSGRRPLLREMGWGRVVSAVMPGNEPALRLQQRSGRGFLGVIDVRFFWRWSRGRIRYASGRSFAAPVRLLEG